MTTGPDAKLSVQVRVFQAGDKPLSYSNAAKPSVVFSRPGNVRAARPDVAKTQQRDKLMQLRAPVDGTVQQLAMHTVGGVVTPAQPLLAVVPAEESLEIEATVLNKDIGFVRPGQEVTVKIASFPYTRYGYLIGTVETVSHDGARRKDGVGVSGKSKASGRNVEHRWRGCANHARYGVECRDQDRQAACD